MKVLFDLTPAFSAHRFRGIGNYVNSLLQANVNNSNQEIWYLIPKYASESLPFKLANTVFYYRPLRPNVKFQWLFSSLFLKKKLSCTDADIFHSTDPMGLVFSNKRTTKTIVTVYDLIPLIQGHFKSKVQDFYDGYSLYLSKLKLADHIISISESTKQDLIKYLGISAEKISVVPLGYDLPEETRFSEQNIEVYPKPFFSFCWERGE